MVRRIVACDDYGEVPAEDATILRYFPFSCELLERVVLLYHQSALVNSESLTSSGGSLKLMHPMLLAAMARYVMGCLSSRVSRLQQKAEVLAPFVPFD